FRVNAMAALLEYEEEEPGGREFELDLEHIEQPAFIAAMRGTRYQVWDAEGNTIGRSEELGGREMEVFAGDRGAPAVRAVTLPDGRSTRQACYTFVPLIELYHSEEMDDEPARMIDPADLDKPLPPVTIA